LQFVISTIQFSGGSRDYLNQLDDQHQDDDGRTQLEHYLHQSIEMVARIGDLYPAETVAFLDDAYFNEKFNQLWFEITVNNIHQPKATRLNGTANSVDSIKLPDMCHIQAGIRDLITMLRVFSR